MIIGHFEGDRMKAQAMIREVQNTLDSRDEYINSLDKKIKALEAAVDR